MMNTFLQQFSIKMKIFALLVLGLLGTLAVGLIGLRATSQMHGLTENLYQDQLMPIRWVAEANQFAIYASRNDYRFIAESERQVMDQLTQTRAKYVAEMQRLLDLYRKTNLIPEESEILKRFDAA